MATYGTSNKYINYSVNSQELSYDINSNTSVVRVWIDVWRTNTGYTTYGTGTVYARINGGVYSAGISTGQKITSTPIRLGTWDVTVGHNADGSKAISVTGWISHSQFSTGEQGYTHTLTTIPRQANITESSNFTDVQNPTIKFSNPGGFNMSVWLEPNPNGPHLAVRDNIPNTGSYTWELTDEERNQLREACKGKTCTIRIGLYSNNKQWASYHDRTYTITNANPSFTSITATPVNPFGSLYLQGKSSIKLTINGAKGIYGSTITTYSIKGGDYSYSGELNTYTTDVLSKSGDITFTATITDSRGFTASKTVKVTVTAYTLPTLTFETYRCDSSGTKDIIKGTYIYVKPTFTYCVITGNAIKTKSIKINNTSKSTAFNSRQGYVFSGYALNTTHEVEVSITDNVGNTVTVIHDIDIGKVLMHIPNHKNGIGFGRYCDVEEQMQIGYDLNIFGSLLINGEKQPIFIEDYSYTVPVKPIEKQNIYFRYSSSSEQFTGEYWIDGRKIYQKIVAVNFSGGTSTTYHGISDLNLVISTEIHWYDNADGAYFKAPREDAANIYIRFQKITASSIYISCAGTDWQPRTKDRYAIIKYVKTT